jgi:hypothetical protein
LLRRPTPLGEKRRAVASAFAWQRTREPRASPGLLTAAEIALAIGIEVTAAIGIIASKCRRAATGPQAAGLVSASAASEENAPNPVVQGCN